MLATFKLASKNYNISVINVDELILFEQRVNLINAPVIAVQLLRIVFPATSQGRDSWLL